MKSSSKKVNALIIEKYTGVTGYKGRSDQRKAIIDQLTKENCDDMRKRVQEFSKDDATIGNSNISKILENLSDDSFDWIGEINN